MVDNPEKQALRSHLSPTLHLPTFMRPLIMLLDIPQYGMMLLLEGGGDPDREGLGRYFNDPDGKSKAFLNPSRRDKPKGIYIGIKILFPLL